MLNINNISIKLMRDFEKEYFDLPNNTYLNYSPIAPIATSTYKTISPNKKDTLCYIKHTTKELWIYEEDNKLIFKPLQKSNLFTKYVQPCVFFLEYIVEPVFFIYKPLGIGKPNVAYLYYNDNSVILKWVDTFDQATKFMFSELNLEWPEFITQNLLSPYSIDVNKNK